jgi:hypothetical protein
MVIMYKYLYCREVMDLCQHFMQSNIVKSAPTSLLDFEWDVFLSTLIDPTLRESRAPDSLMDIYLKVTNRERDLLANIGIYSLSPPPSSSSPTTIGME